MIQMSESVYVSSQSTAEADRNSFWKKMCVLSFDLLVSLKEKFIRLMNVSTSFHDHNHMSVCVMPDSGHDFRFM